MKNGLEISDSKDAAKYSLILQANTADLSLSNTHFIVHSILIASNSVFLASADHIGKFILVCILSFLGMIGGVISSIALGRSKSYRRFWEEEVDREFRSKLNQFRYANGDSRSRHSRVALLMVLVTTYLIIFTYALIAALYRHKPEIWQL